MCQPLCLLDSVVCRLHLVCSTQADAFLIPLNNANPTVGEKMTYTLNRTSIRLN